MGVAYWLKIHPQVRRELAVWERRAQAIHDPALRGLAVEKLTGERLNPEAAALFAVLAPRRRRREVVRLIVAYQVLYDYLDAVNEQPGSTGLSNGLQLHRALTDAILPGQARGDYYRRNPRREDSGYVHSLVTACRRVVRVLPSAADIAPVLVQAAERCGQAQSHNHAIPASGERPIIEWSSAHTPMGDCGYLWWELAAAGISCLAIHALLARTADPGADVQEAARLDRAYFPPICAISALLDSLADYSQDAGTSNHSFVAHYRDSDRAAQRLTVIVQDGAERAKELPHGRRHSIILAGITSFYLSSPSVEAGFPVTPAESLIRCLGPIATPMRAALRVRRYAHAVKTSGQ
jgi:tetraprenyl-beta-curcumene synthase